MTNKSFDSFVFCIIQCKNSVLISVFNLIFDLVSTLFIIQMMIKKGQIWTKQQDQNLAELYQQASCFQKWKFISAKLKQKGIQKTQFQCRQRFMNHVDPTLKKGKLSFSQIRKLFRYYDQYGPKWSFFQTKIQGRTQVLLKNKFYSTLRSLVRQLIKIGQKRNLDCGIIQSSSISTKQLTELYEGKKKFFNCRNILKNILRQVNYCLEGEISQNNLNTISDQTLNTVFFSILQNTKSGQIYKGNNKIESNNKIQNIKKGEQSKIHVNNQGNLIQYVTNSQNQQNNPLAKLSEQNKQGQKIMESFYIFPVQFPLVPDCPQVAYPVYFYCL